MDDGFLFVEGIRDEDESKIDTIDIIVIEAC
jgi:hypothetical protein